MKQVELAAIDVVLARVVSVFDGVQSWIKIAVTVSPQLDFFCYFIRCHFTNGVFGSTPAFALPPDLVETLSLIPWYLETDGSCDYRRGGGGSRFGGAHCWGGKRLPFQLNLSFF